MHDVDHDGGGRSSDGDTDGEDDDLADELEAELLRQGRKRKFGDGDDEGGEGDDDDHVRRVHKAARAATIGGGLYKLNPV